MKALGQPMKGFQPPDRCQSLCFRFDSWSANRPTRYTTNVLLPHCGADVTADNMESISLMTFSSTFKLLIISSCVNATQNAGLI